MHIEPLESRIAPASLVFTDLDGDKVTFTTSTAGLDVNLGVAADGLRSVFSVYFIGPDIEGTNLTVTVAKGKIGNVPGDGKAIIGTIQGGMNNLGAIKIAGDLGDIDAGSGSSTVAAIKSLTVDSFGRFGQRGEDDAYSQITGSVGSLVVRGDFIATNFYVTGNLKSVSVGGSVIGGPASGDGQIYASGDLGKATIKGDIRGGGGVSAGFVGAGFNVGSVTVGGSILGGAGANSGNVLAAFEGDGQVGKVTVRGSLLAGSGNGSGQIGSFFSGNPARVLGISSVTIGGDLTGFISARGDVGSVKIGGDLASSAAGATGFINVGNLSSVAIKGSVIGGDSTYSGCIFATGTIGTVTIGKDLRGGAESNTGFLYAGTKINTVKIAGSIYGGEGLGSGKIGVGGGGRIENVTVGGSIIGGTGQDAGMIGSADAIISIGKVTIGKDLIGGSALRTGSIYSREGAIDELIIKGSVYGGNAANSGHISAGADSGRISIGKNIFGGVGIKSGEIEGGPLGNAVDFESITVGGSIYGGSSDRSGGIHLTGGLGLLKLGGDLRGNHVANTAQIIVPEGIAKKIILGSVIRGTGAGSGVVVG